METLTSLACSKGMTILFYLTRVYGNKCITIHNHLIMSITEKPTRKLIILSQSTIWLLCCREGSGPDTEQGENKILNSCSVNTHHPSCALTVAGALWKNSMQSHNERLNSCSQFKDTWTIVILAHPHVGVPDFASLIILHCALLLLVLLLLIMANCMGNFNITWVPVQGSSSSLTP